MANAATAIKDGKADDKVVAIDRRPPEIPVAALILDFAGQTRRYFTVRLPVDFVLSDLVEPSVWKRVQASAWTLRPHDQMYLIAFDESWVAECVVVDANREAASLSKPRVTQMESRIKQYFSDGKYRCVWGGPGYAAEEITTGRRVTDFRPNEALVIEDIKNLYPKRVAL